jgi:hypothetical protein
MSVNMRRPVVAGILTCQPRNPHAAILGPVQQFDSQDMCPAYGKIRSSHTLASQRERVVAVKLRYERKRLD